MTLQVCVCVCWVVMVIVRVLFCLSLGVGFTCNAGDTEDTGWIPEQGQSPGGGNGNPLQYSCLENPMDRGAWQATVQSQKELDPTQATEHARRGFKHRYHFHGNISVDFIFIGV